MQIFAEEKACWLAVCRMTPPPRRVINKLLNSPGKGTMARLYWPAPPAEPWPPSGPIQDYHIMARTQHSFGGSFSAGSKPIFASKYAFCSIFQNLQENHLLASKFCKFLLKNIKILQNFALSFAEICKICSREDDHGERPRYEALEVAS